MWIISKSHREKFFFFDIFAIHSSSRHEKCCQMSVRLFSLFQGSRNQQWKGYAVKRLYKKRALISGWCWSNTAYYNLETFSSYVQTRWKDWKINYNCYHYTLHWRSYTIKSCRQVISIMIQGTHSYCKLLNCWCFIFFPSFHD